MARYYEKKKRKPAQPHTEVAHIVASRIILRAMQEGAYLQGLLSELSATYPKPFDTNDTLNALKKIADTHKHKVGKDDQKA